MVKFLTNSYKYVSITSQNILLASLGHIYMCRHYYSLIFYYLFLDILKKKTDIMFSKRKVNIDGKCANMISNSEMIIIID